jgi:UDP-N-acetylmuramyl pentapeptide phosphotransferase/UDP-N-acetylglucosamine-1-phosphate transferase
MFLTGLADDIWSLKPATKLVIEIAVASAFLYFGYHLNWVNGVTVDWMLTLIWIVGLTNAFNLLDNMDGLCAGIAVVAGVAFLATGAAGHEGSRRSIRCSTWRRSSARCSASSSTTRTRPASSWATAAAC